MSRVVVFAGTTEGRLLSYRLADLGAEVLVCVATEYGREEQGEHPGVTVRAGRLEAEAMAALLQGTAAAVDATHPYAAQASVNIRKAAKRAGVPYLRLLRKESPLPAGSVQVQSAEEAAAYLQGREGSVLLTCGAKELAAFAPLEKERLYPRVLPSVESLEACLAAGIPKRNIIAMQGPFSVELNLALLRQFSVRFLVTKDGGAAGGFPEKAEAARKAGAQLVVIARPRDGGLDGEEVLKRLKELL